MFCQTNNKGALSLISLHHQVISDLMKSSVHWMMLTEARLKFVWSVELIWDRCELVKNHFSQALEIELRYGSIVREERKVKIWLSYVAQQMFA